MFLHRFACICDSIWNSTSSGGSLTVHLLGVEGNCQTESGRRRHSELELVLIRAPNGRASRISFGQGDNVGTIREVKCQVMEFSFAQRGAHVAIISSSVAGRIPRRDLHFHLDRHEQKDCFFCPHNSFRRNPLEGKCCRCYHGCNPHHWHSSAARHVTAMSKQGKTGCRGRARWSGKPC